MFWLFHYFSLRFRRSIVARVYICYNFSQFDAWSYFYDIILAVGHFRIALLVLILLKAFAASGFTSLMIASAASNILFLLQIDLLFLFKFYRQHCHSHGCLYAIISRLGDAYAWLHRYITLYILMDVLPSHISYNSFWPCYFRFQDRGDGSITSRQRGVCDYIYWQSRALLFTLASTTAEEGSSRQKCTRFFPLRTPPHSRASQQSSRKMVISRSRTLAYTILAEGVFFRYYRCHASDLIRHFIITIGILLRRRLTPLPLTDYFKALACFPRRPRHFATCPRRRE